MKVLDLFDSLHERTLKKSGIDHMRVYLEDKHYNDFIFNYSVMYKMTGCDHCCSYRPCCYYKGKTGELQLFDLRTGKYMIMNLTKHEVNEDQVKQITEIVNQSLDYWFNLYSDETKDQFVNTCVINLKDGRFGYDRINYFNGR